MSDPNASKPAHVRRVLACALCVLGFASNAWAARARAEAPTWLRSENRNVRDGNEKLAAGDQKTALEDYDKAARELPSEGGVHLDRGLALMRAGDLAKAREALRLATQPPASNEVRADAYYNLGNAFYKEADALANQDKPDEAQPLFREATDSFRHALRLRPGDRNAAWNLELGARRIHEQEEKQKQKQQQDKDKDKQDGDQQNQDQNQDKNKDQGDQNRDKQNGDQQKDKAQQDQQKKDQQQAQKPDAKKKDEQGKDKQKQDEQANAPQPKPEQARPEVERALDALQDSEENLERLRAMNRAARERRKPEKDW